MIVAAQKDPEFLRALQSADLAIPDGIGIVAAMRLLSLSPQPSALSPSRISGISLMEDLIALAARNGWRVLLLGGKEGIAERAAELLRRKVPQVPTSRPSHPSDPFSPSLIHAISGPPDITRASRRDLDHLITSINKIKPDLLFVAFGHGKQEKWLSANRYRLHAGVAMGVGGALDQIVDPTLRPPAYINSIGLGWLYRLIREPRRWRRQLALVRFVWMVFAQHVVALTDRSK